VEDTVLLLRTLERLDRAWDEVLARPLADPAVQGEAGEQMLFYFLHRHLTAAPSGEDAAAAIRFAVLSRRAVSALSAGDGKDVLRAYSAEVEYSEENTEALLSALLPRPLR
jgi:hypothetical protein